ncbi:DUF2268 domain-containing protein [Aquibacillus rhizosphaerae]|uniref:DUF2268 domain-containing putative Zn-dependent protease n=1 Tax=Aquibacillus rhizosphaerae TaxID=3051431 RepID=A0ABT7L584_9BACI|nr:DUF2268 domain-containing putative Zn-dependent protease [Aquibacillus sp. LR5S19]MDL4841022.1 DUF2268 domain-containing putative Zn-dependent protease [Aquibacillus sp. LR5S19]
MVLVETNKWLDQYTQKKGSSFKKNILIQRTLLCEPLTDFFNDATAEEIHMHLLNHGLFIPDPLDKQVIKEIIDKDFWQLANQEINQLQNDWNGPDVPVFIFPSNYTNKLLIREFNGLAGLSYQDKIFLFVTNHTNDDELQSLITHEYNHACRLSLSSKSEEELNLLDGLVLEGLAEFAVKQRLGDKNLTKWTNIYSKQVINTHWEKWIKPNLTIKKMEKKHDQLMYGLEEIPKWLGYSFGFQLVSSFFEHENTTMYESLRLPSSAILEGSDFH